MELDELRKLDELYGGAGYDTETLTRILPHIIAYVTARALLRDTPLGETAGASVLLAGGKR